jgi:hypothetical protein
MTALDALIPRPRLAEVHRVDLSARPEQVWAHVRHGALAHSSGTRALFALRTALDRTSRTVRPPGAVRLDNLTSSPERPGFQILVDDPPREVAVAAIGKVWRVSIPFVHVATREEYAAFAAPDFVKVAWAIRVTPLRDCGSHVELEVRVDATDDAAWRRFGRYFHLIGPASRFIRRSLLRALVRQFGAAAGCEDERALPGDERLPDAREQITHRIDIAAAPEAIWPWLVQMGCRRGGFYSIDALDNGGRRSVREIHPELQRLDVGDVIPATPRGSDGFEVLRVEPRRVLVLGGLHDVGARRQLAFSDTRPGRFWHVTWAFVLEPLDARSTRLVTRARAAFSPGERRHARWIRPVHHVMQTAQLRNLARRAEGQVARDDWRDIRRGVVGAVRMTAAFLTPFLRRRRAHWGLDARLADRSLPGDELVAQPRWSWTHGVEIDAPASRVWPWVAQIGADRGGFYSYQWLENVAGCGLRNAEIIHPEWEVKEGQGLVLHPDAPPLRVVSLERGRHFIAHAPAAPRAVADGTPWVAASWLFLIEPLGPERCRFVSRYRVSCSDDLATRLSFGPALVEPIGNEMDRRMLLGVKQRVERAQSAVLTM